MSLFAALQIPPGPTSTCFTAAQTFLEILDGQSIPCRVLKLYGPLQQAMLEFARFQLDAARYDMPLVQACLERKLAVIVPTRSGYTVFRVDGRSARIPASSMQQVFLPGYGMTVRGQHVSKEIST